MGAKITIIITEDDAPDGNIHIGHEVEGFSLDGARDQDLPAALLLGAKMLQLAGDLPDAEPLGLMRLWEQED